MEFAIVDIETTGGYAAANGITEVSIHLHDGEKVFHRYDTLINPQTSIPRFITGLTGINDEMVKSAPTFGQVAEHIFELLQHRVFVAHSVNFDYSFLKNALKESGFELQSKKLCTVRLSRKVFPGLPSYSLGNICNSLDISIQNRHRAGGDAEATVILFEKLLAKETKMIYQFLKRNSKEQALPPNLPKEEFEKLPETPGVYYFLNQKRKVVYVGKAVNLRKRVSGHFSNNSPSRQKQDFMRHIYHLRFTECETESEAFELETKEIKRIWPQFNRAQKGYEPIYGVVHYFDQNGFARLAIKKVKNRREAQIIVPTILEGQDLLRHLVSEHSLCLRLSGIPKSEHHCIDEHCVCCNSAKKEIRTYNKKVQEAISPYLSEIEPIAAVRNEMNLFSEQELIR